MTAFHQLPAGLSPGGQDSTIFQCARRCRDRDWPEPGGCDYRCCRCRRDHQFLLDDLPMTSFQSRGCGHARSTAPDRRAARKPVTFYPRALLPRHLRGQANNLPTLFFSLLRFEPLKHPRNSISETDERHLFDPSCLTTGAPNDEHDQPENQSNSVTRV